MNEEEKKAIRDLIDSSNLSLIGDGTIITSRETIGIILNLIETQKAELEKRDKMIDLMIDTILKNDDNYWYLFDANKKAVEEYFLRLVEGEKKDG